MNFKRYFNYWLKTNSLTLQSLLADKTASILFVLGKFIRFFLMVGFLLALKQRLNLVAGYNLDQLVVFFLIFNLFDILSQFFFRGIYWFRSEIVSGDFDFKLLKPINPLFQVLTSHTDFLDLPLLVLVIVLLFLRAPAVGFRELLAFIVLSLVSLLILTAVHIFVTAVGVITTEVDHIIWIFRSFSGMAQAPVDIYAPAVRNALTFIIPVGLIFTFPAKTLYGLLNFPAVLSAIIFSLLFYFLSLKFWAYSLKKYSSASS